MNIFEKIKIGIAYDRIIEDIRIGFESELNRIHLITKKDVHNIAAEFFLSETKPCEDFNATKGFINDLGSAAIFTKFQDEICDKYSSLEEKDFITIIMNETQSDMLRRFGDNIICIDSTHGTSPYDFQLTTVMVIDDLSSGFPCVFMYSNRIDHVAIEILFSEIKQRIGPLKTKVFMSDMANSYYNGFINVMETPENRLFCNWHVEKAWKENLNKVKTKEKKIMVYKMLKTLMHETDRTAFNKILDYVLNWLKTNSETVAFHQYFERYAKNAECWSFAYRVNCHINTNNYLESMHRTLKHCYFDGKHTKSLHQSLKILMRFIRDKVFEKAIRINKGKITAKHKWIRAIHKKAIDATFSIEQCERFWIIDRKFKVSRRLDSPCNCDLKCIPCNACIDDYYCSCTDYLIRWNMCVHIHFVLSKCQPQNASVVNDLDNADHLYTKNFDDEFQKSFPVDVHQTPSFSLRENLIADYSSILSSCNKHHLQIFQLHLEEIKKEIATFDASTDTTDILTATTITTTSAATTSTSSSSTTTVAIESATRTLVSATTSESVTRTSASATITSAPGTLAATATWTSASRTSASATITSAPGTLAATAARTSASRTSASATITSAPGTLSATAARTSASGTSASATITSAPGTLAATAARTSASGTLAATETRTSESASASATTTSASTDTTFRSSISKKRNMEPQKRFYTTKRRKVQKSMMLSQKEKNEISAALILANINQAN